MSDERKIDDDDYDEEAEAAWEAELTRNAYPELFGEDGKDAYLSSPKLSETKSNNGNYEESGGQTNVIKPAENDARIGETVEAIIVSPAVSARPRTIEAEKSFERRLARESGPMDDDDDDDRVRVPAKYQKALEEIKARHFAEEHYISENGTNYHYDTDLTDDHLPDLHFKRIDNFFTARTANAFLNTPIERPAKRHLFGELWKEGELMLLFADTGLGKSVLAMQIGAALAGGEPIEPFAPTTEPHRVLYLDFELTDAQFSARYTDPDGRSYPEDEKLFPDELIRCPPLTDPFMLEDSDDHHNFLIRSVTYLINYSRARTVIVDNITWLSASTEHSVAAQRLMRTLVELKNRLGLSILVIAHTPKMRRGLPVELNHLQGSKMLANFADNIIGMGRSSSGKDLRYLKPLKQRNTAARFDEKCVPVFRLKREGRMLGFTFVDNEPEARHIEGYLRGAALTEAIREDKMKRAIEMSNAGDTVREIAEKLGLAVGTVSHYVHGRGSKVPPNPEITENAHFCSHVFTSRGSQCEQESDFLNEKENFDE